DYPETSSRTEGAYSHLTCGKKLRRNYASNDASAQHFIHKRTDRRNVQMEYSNSISAHTSTINKMIGQIIYRSRNLHTTTDCKKRLRQHLSMRTTAYTP